MLTGYNHNIRYRDRVFHVQTEDLGRKKHQIVTHLFLGGDIVNTKKADYEDLLGSGDFESRVKSIIDRQHREMLGELLSGALDPMISRHDSTMKTAPGPQPAARRDPGRPAESDEGLKGVPPVREKSFDLLVLEFLEKNR